ncbi:MAG TPA: dihydroorotate oxidase [Candidatus Nanoarchaeia archaeon]|nr:dihydroorotate oxidase [Candidatus Nanoarchaeia archaeon]
MSYKTSIAGIELKHPIFNAAGPLCVSLEELHAIGYSHSSAITTKSMTILPRDGNPEPRYYELPYGSINSMGLPNHGYLKYIEYLPQLRAHGKPLIASVSGLSLADNMEIIRALNDADCDLIELNVSCPNIVGKPQIGYDMEQTDDVLSSVMKVVRKPLGVKLPPYFDFVHYEQIATLLNKHKVRFVSCINSPGNALYIDADRECAVIKPKGGFGGLGGTYIKPIGLANVRKFFELLHHDIDIVGVGGINNGRDVFEYVLAGARAVQLGTIFMHEKHKCFARIVSEFDEVMAKKGYGSIEDVRGKLRGL